MQRVQQGAPGKRAGAPVFLHLHELLAYYARTAPSDSAILGPAAFAMTYGQLWERTNYTLRALRNLGIGRSDRVAVILPNGPEAAMAIVAVASASVCVPLNPSFTADEWQRYFGDLQIGALLTRADMASPSRAVAHVLGIPVIDLSPLPRAGIGAFELAGTGTRRAVEVELPPGGENEAFILLTSGTAARPKLVPLTHQSICRSAHNAGAVLRLQPRDRLLCVLPLFHAHGLISGLLTAVAAGSSVVCMPVFEPSEFFSFLTEFEPTWYTAVPAIHRAVLAAASRHNGSLRHSSLRVIRSASASLPPSAIGELESLFGVPVIETYGMTEAASQIAANSLKLRKPGSVGRSAGAEIAIINSKGSRLPPGKRGEIVLRGPTITKGYKNDVAATKAAFRDGWFRTGDLGYLDEDGYLFIVGRIKEVINRGGQKIAPADVEEVLLSHPGVLEAAAFSIPHRQLGEDVAAAVVLRPDAKVTQPQLQKFASERLARFKIPRVIRVVREIPKGPGGKIRRSGLAARLSMMLPDSQPGWDGQPVPPRSRLERQVASIWADLLELDRISVDEDVFALGADSITTTQMLSRLRTHFGIELSFNDIFDAPTIAALADRIGSVGRKPAAAPPSLRDTRTDVGSVPLSFQQQRIQVLSSLDPTGYAYNIGEVIRLSGRLDFEALESSIASICERHEVLRSTFPNCPGEPLQIVGPARPRVEPIDMRPCAKSRRAAAIRQQARETLRRPFHLDSEPPLLVQLLQFDDDDHALLVKVHHLVTDGWSQQLLWQELGALYRTNLNKARRDLPELVVQYRHFVEWQRAWLATPAADAQRNYWRTQLAGTAQLRLPTDRPRPAIRSGRGARQPLKFSGSLSRAIKSVSRGHGVTLFMTLLAAFQCLLARYTQQDDVTAGSAIANRDQIEIEHLVGMFANTIVLRTDLSCDPSFIELLRRTRQVTLDAYRNQDLPFEEVLRILELPRSMDSNPLFQVMFILQNPAPKVPALNELSAEFVRVDPGIARVDLMLELIDADEGLHGWFEYSTDLFSAATMRRMAGHLKTLLNAIVADPGQRISRLPLLSAEECKQILVDWNRTQTDFGPHVSLWERFAKQARRAPDAIAASAAAVRLSYRELARRSFELADRLVMCGVGPDIVVVVLAQRGPDLLVAMLAVQRAGGAFLLLDPALPAARLGQIIQHSGTPLVLTAEGCAGALKKALSGIPIRRRPQAVSLAKGMQTAVRGSTRPVQIAAANLAYVIYTSGSTGVPKGAMIEQRGLLNHLLFKISDLGLSASDVIAQTAPQSFDISVWQFLVAPLIGGRVHIFADEEVRDPALLARAIGREGVTVLQIVPAMLRAILDRISDEFIGALRRLRWLICIGEALTPDLCHNWLRHFPNVPLINAYGPAECSDTVAMHPLTAGERLDTVPIGRPVANTRLYVLDAHLQPVPTGIIGELCVGGVGVGRGYLNDPEQTRRSFISNPFSPRRGARLYRTGDLARWRFDGVLEFVGRVDHQVKIRGCRVELEEIECVLTQHPEVQAAVVLERDDPGGAGTLIAHIVATGCGEPEVNELRQFLKARLPEYMIPQGFIFLDRIPRNAHGKVDCVALGAIRHGVKIGINAFVAPRDSVEAALVRIWMDLLKLDQIGVFDNFFELGGHSLVAGRALARVADAFGASLPLRAIFEAPTVAALARRIDKAREVQLKAPTPQIVRKEDNGPYTVSITQEHILRIERALPELPQFNLPFAYRLQGPLNVPALERSLIEVVRRHESLRMRFGWIDERPVAVVTPAGETDSFFALEDLAARAASRSRRAKAVLLKIAELKAEQEACTPFDIQRAPLFRVRLLRLGDEDHAFLLILHHNIIDGWSIGVFLEEVSELYAAVAAGRETELPPPALRFSDFARWQREWCDCAAAGLQFAYWKDRLRAAAPVFPLKRRLSGAVLTSQIVDETFRLSKEAVARLNALSRSQGATLFMTLLAGFKALLLAKSGRNDICVATAMANRSQPGTERVIGPLVNTTIIRTRMELGLSFQSALARVRASVLDAYSRQEFPFQVLAERLIEEGSLDPAALTQLYFVLQSAFRPLHLPDVSVRPFAYPDGQRVSPIARTWLSIALKETGSGITGSWSYKPDLFQRGAPHHWMKEYAAILTKAAANPELSLERLTKL